MSNQRHHGRQPSIGRKVPPPHVKAVRPAPLTSRKSYTGHGHAHPHPNKAGSGSSKKAGGEDSEVADEEAEDAGMASFIQFCATCERQIVTPRASILYCSAACRRRDSRITSLELIQHMSTSLHSPTLTMAPSASSFDHPPPDIVPQRSPTIVRPPSMAFSDLDISDSGPRNSFDFSSREEDRGSDPTDYLEQFFSGFASTRNTARPRLGRANTTGTGGNSSTNLPSLVHSPSSSFGTIASNASYRALPPRHSPFEPTYASTKSVDLVIPYPTATNSSPTQLMKDGSLKSNASTLTSFRVAESSDISHEKRRSSRRDSASATANQSLKQLFSHDAMKAPPEKG